jgi:hypothetical protein
LDLVLKYMSRSPCHTDASFPNVEEKRPCSQAQDNVLLTGKIEEYEAAFKLVDTDGKGTPPL